MDKQKGISIPLTGMNRNTGGHSLSEQQFAFQLNGRAETEEGYALTAEHSNILATKFKDGFKFIGGKNHVVRNKTYIFLTNPDTKVSEIGYIVNEKGFEYQADSEGNCSSCIENKSFEAVPLEEQEQIAHQVYETLLEDSCNLCLGFDVDHPIVDIIIKEQNIGTKIFWTSTPGKKEFRYINLDDLEDYKKTGDDSCGAEPETTCLDCDKLRVFRLYSELKTKDYVRTLGGNLKKGSYEILGAYTDQLGNEFTSYTNLSPIIPIFDEANIIHEQEDNNAETNFAIKLELDNVDKGFDYYKIAVRYYTSKGVFTSFEEGVHGTSDKLIIISNNNGTSISNTKLALVKPFIETVDGITAASNMLILNGVREREPINLQPVVSLAGLGVKWMSFRAKENLYANADSYKYLGYNRDENSMFSLDFGFKDGFRTNTFTFIPRPATADEMSTFNTGDDYASITATVGDCDENLRTKKWQYYNTATSEGVCPAGEGVETVTQEETVTSYTSVEVPSTPSGQIVIASENIEEYTDLKTYIEANIEECSALLQPICQYVDLANLTAYNKIPDAKESCGNFNMVSEEVVVESVNNENVTYNTKNKQEYAVIIPPLGCSIYQVDATTGLNKIDENFSYAFNVDSWSGSPVISTKARVNSVYNTSCNSATLLSKVEESNADSTQLGSYYHLNKGADTIAGLQTVKNVTAISGTRFTDKLHSGAMWFKTKVSGRESFFIEISKQSDCSESNESEMRVSIFNSCSTTDSIYSTIIDTKQHNFIEIDSQIIENLIGEDIYVAVDLAIVPSLGYGENYSSVDFESAPTNRLRLSNLCGCFNIVDRETEYTSMTVDYTSIDLSKSQKYETECSFEVPVLSDCEPIPYAYGQMGYYESTDKYPDNEELYDSSKLIINKSRITSADLLNKLKVYKEKETENVIFLSEAANFRCKNIRAYKFPDNKVSPFMREEAAISNAESVISPLGLTIDGEIIRNLLDVAVDNGLITQEQRSSITDYKIYRSDSTLSRSVVASGIVFNSKKYKVEDEEVSYFNYPFNSLGKDKYFPNSADNDFNNIQVISPEFDYFAPSLPSEMSLQGFIFGKSNSRVLPVEDHAKMVILGSKAKSLAKTLATLEAIAEGVIAIAQSAEVYRVQIGFANSANPVGIGLNVAVAAVQIASSIAYKVGRYRLEWLRSFENLGTPYNFGYYVASGSNYNYLKPLQKNGDRLRGLTVKKYLKSGMLNVSDTTTGKVLKINNIDREEAVFFSLGDFPIKNLDSEYTSYDNSDSDPSNSSQVLSQEIGCSKGKSPEVNRNIASPYVAFKNYIPNQYGSVDSVKWVDTTYTIDISTSGLCNGILGGDTFISRHSKKRKVRLFETDLLGSAALTPFPYKFNSNYGEPKYYVDYKVNSEFTTNGSTFPEVYYDAKLDCGGSNSGFYVEPPGKFYLYNISFTNFLCETRINTNFRNARKEPWNQFYPQNTDYEAITQPITVSLTRPESFFYNKAYLQTSVNNSAFGLSELYSKENEAKKAYNINSGIYSMPDENQDSITEPWLMYRPNDRFTLESKYGKLISMKGIESDQILMYFEDALQLQNSVNPFTDGNTAYNADLGNGGIFAKRAITLRSTDLGYAGTQSKQTLSCEYGHFHADLKRGQIFSFDGKNITEISKYSGGKPNGMDIWFKEHLPLKISKFFKNYNQDNPYNKTGIHWGFDSKYKRVLLTKKDYIPINECVEYVEGKGFILNKSKCGENRIPSCPEGFTYNSETDKCVSEYTLINMCPDDYTYDEVNKKCVKIETATPIFKTPTVKTIVQPTCTQDTGSFIIEDFKESSVYTFTPTIISITTEGKVTANPGSYTFTETGDDGCISENSAIIELVSKPVTTGIATPNTISTDEGVPFTVNLSSPQAGTTFTWTVLQQGTSGAAAGSGNTITQTLQGGGTATYTVTPYNETTGCVGAAFNVIVTSAVVGVACGGSVSGSGTQGYYELTASVGTDTGQVTIQFDAYGVPDRIQAVWDNAVVADSLFVGNAVSSFVTQIKELTSLNKFLYNGTTFVANGVQAVSYTDSDISDYSGTTRASGSVGGQIGVVANYPLATSKASDGKIQISFNKTTAYPTDVKIVVVGIQNTIWLIEQLICPTY